MSDRKIIESSLYPYHVTARSKNREWFALPMKQSWEIAISSLKKTYERYPFEIYAFVLMSNHYHLILRTPQLNLDQIVYAFNHIFSNNMKRCTEHGHKLLVDHYQWTLIENRSYLFNVFKYVYQNPLRADLVRLCQDYPYSDLYYQAKGLSFELPLHNFYFIDNYFLEQINQVPENPDSIKNGLKSKRFYISYRKPNAAAI